MSTPGGIELDEVVTGGNEVIKVVVGEHIEALVSFGRSRRGSLLFGRLVSLSSQLVQHELAEGRQVTGTLVLLRLILATEELQAGRDVKLKVKLLHLKHVYVSSSYFEVGKKYYGSGFYFNTGILPMLPFVIH